MKCGRQMRPLKVTSTPYFKSRSFNYFKMVEVRNSEVNTVPSPFSLLSSGSRCQDR
jgi:hypothetical protein